MCPEKTPPLYQPTLALEPKAPGVWEQLPEAQRQRCRQLLVQLLRQVVLQVQRSGRLAHERED
jgi:hypothetical protein